MLCKSTNTHTHKSQRNANKLQTRNMQTIRYDEKNHDQDNRMLSKEQLRIPNPTAINFKSTEL